MNNPIRAMMDALAAHFSVALVPGIVSEDGQAPGALAYIQVGWPDQRELAHYPSISIDAPGGGDFIGRAPRLIYPLPQANGVPASFHYTLGTIRSDLQIDIWADSAPQRDRVMNAIRASLRAQVEFGSILRLPVALGGDLPDTITASYTMQSMGVFADSSAGVGTDQWRGTFLVAAEMEEVATIAQVGLAQLDLVLTVEGHQPIVPGDTITVFENNGGPVPP